RFVHESSIASQVPHPRHRVAAEPGRTMPVFARMRAIATNSLPSLPIAIMNVFANTVVTLSFKLYDSSNQLIEETDEPIAYLHGGHSGIFPTGERGSNHKK